MVAETLIDTHSLIDELLQKHTYVSKEEFTIFGNDYIEICNVVYKRAKTHNTFFTTQNKNAVIECARRTNVSNTTIFSLDDYIRERVFDG